MIIQHTCDTRLSARRPPAGRRKKSVFICTFQKLIILFFLGSLPGITENACAREISLEQAVQMAVTHSHDLKTAQNEVRYATLALEKEKNDYLPTVTGTLDSRLASDYGKSRSERNTYTADAGLAVSLNLFNGFEDEASCDAARHELSSYAFTAVRQEQQVIFDTATAYLSVVKQLQQIDVAVENLAYNRLKEKEIQAFYDAGKIPVTDLYQQQAQTADAKLDLISARNTLKVAKLELANLMGTTDINGITFTQPDIDNSAGKEKINIDLLVSKAFQTRADLLALGKEVLAKKAGIKEAQAGKYARLDLNAGVTGAWENIFDDDSGSRIDRDSMDTYLGITVSLPIFDKHLTRVRVSQARIDKQSAQLSVEKLKEQIRVEIGEAVADYLTACETIKEAETQLFYSNKALESASLRYKMGKSSLTDLIQIQSDLVEAKKNVNDAQIDQILKMISIFYYRGDLGLSHLLERQLS